MNNEQIPQDNQPATQQELQIIIYRLCKTLKKKDCEQLELKLIKEAEYIMNNGFNVLDALRNNNERYSLKEAKGMACQFFRSQKGMLMDEDTEKLFDKWASTTEGKIFLKNQIP
jgi:hypothetical protein